MSQKIQQEPYEDVLMKRFSVLFENKAPSELKSFGSQAWDRLQKIGFPNKKSEAFQYVSFRKLCETLEASDGFSSEINVTPFILDESKQSVLVFKDGVFCKELSSIPPSLIVYSLEEALKSSYSPFFKHRMQQIIQQEEDSFALLNAALCQEGVFIYAPAKTVIETPIQILHVQTDASLSYVGPRVHCFLGAHANIQVVSSFKSVCETDCSKTLYNDFLDVSLEEGSVFSHVLYTEEDYAFWGFSSFRASLKKESTLNSFFATFGSPGFRRDYFVSLIGERASANLNGLTALGASFESHVHVHMDHSAPSCNSYQFFKNVLGANSRSSFTGKIHVKRAAQKTEAYQLNQNLLLSDHATANTKPNLEIFADDVKASHGATVSQIDEEQLFYLRTRGISSLEAKTLLTVGFCQEILDKIPVKSLSSQLLSLCRRFLLTQK